jgi:N4-gp56 family major capsid protein
MDKYLRDIFLTVANKWYAKADGTTGAAVGDVAGQMTKDTLQGVIEAAKNLNIPKLRRGGDEFFAMVCSANTIRQIRADDYWLDARKYVDPSDMLTGEAGRLDDVVFLDTTHMHDLQQTGVGAGGADVNRSVLIGADCVGYGESVPMELIPEAPEDFGRKQAIAWYTIAGAGILNDYGFDIYTKAGVPA